MFNYEIWMRKFGVRTAAMMLNPRMNPLSVLELPRESILHYDSGTKTVLGPPSDLFILRGYEQPISVFHVTDLLGKERKGLPRPASTPPDLAIRKFHAGNRRYRRGMALEQSLKNKILPVVYNYSMLSIRYLYIRSIFSEYNSYWNNLNTMWLNIAESVKLSGERNHFIQIKLPTVLPSITQLRKAEAVFNQETLKVFNTHEMIFMLELWKWAGANRSTSVMSAVQGADLYKINLVFEEAGKWTAINLGSINAWRRTQEGESVAEGEKPNSGFEPMKFQNLLLRFIMAVYEERTVSDSAPLVDEGDVSHRPHDEAPSISDPEHEEDAHDELLTGKEVEGILFDKDIPDILSADMELAINDDLAALDELISKAKEKEAAKTADAIFNAVDRKPEDGVLVAVNTLADTGHLSANEFKRHVELSETYKTIVAPDGTTMDKFIVIDPEVLKIKESRRVKDIKSVIDKNMLKSSLLDFDSKYIREVLDKDIAAMVMGVQNAGISVTEYKKETHTDITGSYDRYNVRIVPVEGLPSNLVFQTPKMEEDGSFKSNGIYYNLRKQRGDKPIRKTAPDTVALTSYYGKNFVTRSDKKVNNYGEWLTNNILRKGLDKDDLTVTNPLPNNVFDPSFKSPRLYSILAQRFSSLTLKEFDCSFNHTKREELFGKDIIAKYELDGSIVVGISKKGNYLVMDRFDGLHAVTPTETHDLPEIEAMLDLPSLKAPIDFTQLKVLGKNIPLGIVLAYYLGLDKLCQLLKVVPRKVPAGQRLNLDMIEYPIVFQDETLIFSKHDKQAALILAGFNEYHKAIKQFSVYEFDRPGVYLSVLESNKLSARYIRELTIVRNMFVDPITLSLLKEANEPQDWIGILLRANDLLLTDEHPAETDGAYMRIKGYERIAGAVYSEIVKSVRSHAGSPGRSKQKIDLNPFAVWQTIVQDPSIQIVNAINPIQNIKEQEAITYSGTGGRSSRSMVKRTRAYHRNDMGTISESTVDAADVGINIYSSADPMFNSLRGTSNTFDVDNPDAASLLSTPALLSVGAVNDAVRRVAFISIQRAHMIACPDYIPLPVRTGYEQVIAQRTGDLFAYAAKQDGKVISVTDKGVIVENADGSLIGVEIGRRFGESAGVTIPHTVVSNVKEGQKFKAGDILTYNTGFFVKDMLNPSNVVMKSGVLVKTALLESSMTFEDSSVISSRMADKLKTETTKIKSVVLTFDQEVHKVVKVGQEITPEDALCLIEEAATAGSGIFDNETLDTLKVLSQQAPQAHVKGVVEKIEVIYHGDKEDMSATLLALVNASDKELTKVQKSVGKTSLTGEVDSSYRVDGAPLSLDTLVIKFYITVQSICGAGDKAVFSNQLKTVVGQIDTDEIRTESGVIVDAKFGAKSVFARIVNSPFMIGTTTTLLMHFSKEAARIYNGK